MEQQARARVTPESPEQFTEEIVTAVADAEGVAPHELRPSLYDVVDPDALEMLFADGQQTRTSDLTIQFVYGNWNVRIDSSGEITVTDTYTETDN
jgi:hypothetical protein